MATYLHNPPWKIPRTDEAGNANHSLEKCGLLSCYERQDSSDVIL